MSKELTRENDRIFKLKMEKNKLYSFLIIRNRNSFEEIFSGKLLPIPY